MLTHVEPTSREQVGPAPREPLLVVFSEQSFSLPHRGLRLAPGPPRLPGAPEGEARGTAGFCRAEPGWPRHLPTALEQSKVYKPGPGPKGGPTREVWAWLCPGVCPGVWVPQRGGPLPGVAVAVGDRVQVQAAVAAVGGEGVDDVPGALLMLPAALLQVLEFACEGTSPVTPAAAAPRAWVSPPTAQSKGFTRCTYCPRLLRQLSTSGGYPSSGNYTPLFPLRPPAPSACLLLRPTGPQEGVLPSPPCSPVTPASSAPCLLWEPILPGPPGSWKAIGPARCGAMWQTGAPLQSPQPALHRPGSPCPLPHSPGVTPARDLLWKAH